MLNLILTRENKFFLLEKAIKKYTKPKSDSKLKKCFVLSVHINNFLYLFTERFFGQCIYKSVVKTSVWRKRAISVG